MDCLDFADRLEALVDDALAEEERLRAAAHAARCPDCRALLAAMRSESAPGVEAPADLTEAILAGTSGPACGQARTRLGDFIDGVLPGADHDLVDAHLRHCPDCIAVVTALARLAEDLPAFSALRPDPELVVDVVARTLPRHRRWSRFLDGARETGRQLLARPRIAWETGCGVALAVWLIGGMSWSPLSAAAVEVQAFVQRSAAGTQAVGARSVAALDRTVATLRGEAVRVTAGGASEAADWLARLSSWPRRAVGAAPDLGRHWRQLTRALENRDVFGGVHALRSLSRDAGAMLAELLLSPFSSASSTKDAAAPARRNRP